MPRWCIANFLSILLFRTTASMPTNPHNSQHVLRGTGFQPVGLSSMGILPIGLSSKGDSPLIPNLQTPKHERDICATQISQAVDPHGQDARATLSSGNLASVFSTRSSYFSLNRQRVGRNAGQFSNQRRIIAQKHPGFHAKHGRQCLDQSQGRGRRMLGLKQLEIFVIQPGLFRQLLLRPPALNPQRADKTAGYLIGDSHEAAHRGRKLISQTP